MNWVEILKRIFSLYNVKTQAELGMALNLSVNIGMDGNPASAVIPWNVLERVVWEKNVSWDWLLTGKAFSGSGSSNANFAKASPPPPPVRSRVPRIETRELTRELLGGENISLDQAVALSEEKPPEEAARPGDGMSEGDDEGDGKEQPPPDAAMRELRNIKDFMQKEVGRVDDLLNERD